MERTMTQVLEEMRSYMQRMGEEYSREFGVFATLKRRTEDEDGALPARIKKIIAIALAVACGCEWCIALHTREALDAGATREEIMEGCFIALLMGGGPAVAHIQLVVRAIDEWTAERG